MELLIRDGDYVPDGSGGFLRLEGAQELLERVLFRLVARRGGMPFLPELGSLLHTLGREKPSERRGVAMQYVTQALSNKDYSAIQGFILVATLFSMVLYLILDLIQMAIDPRIKY